MSVVWAMTLTISVGAETAGFNSGLVLGAPSSIVACCCSARLRVHHLVHVDPDALLSAALVELVVAFSFGDVSGEVS